MIRGVMKISSSCLSVLSSVLRNNRPTYGRSPRNGVFSVAVRYLILEDATQYDRLRVVDQHLRLDLVRVDTRNAVEDLADRVLVHLQTS